MNDPADVWLVNPHAKGDGGHDDLCPVVLKVALRLCAPLRLKSGVIESHIESASGQHLEDLACLFAGAGVHDDRALLR